MCFVFVFVFSHDLFFSLGILEYSVISVLNFMIRCLGVGPFKINEVGHSVGSFILLIYLFLN